jgi:hypothetical protein
MRLGDLVCKAIAEVQSGRMYAFAPALLGLRDPLAPRRALMQASASASPRMIAMSAEVSTAINGANPRRHKGSPGSVRPAAPQLP